MLSLSNKLKLANPISTPIETGGNWILSAGTWNDSGLWVDSETWKDL